MGRVDGKVCLVTGSAIGMGRSHAILLAREGAKVIVCDLNEAKGKETVDEIISSGGSAEFIKLNVSQESDWQSALSLIVAKQKRLDVLVNNAGIISYGPMLDTSLAEWNKIFSINAAGTFLGCRESANVMKLDGGGSIINISSALSLVGAQGMSAYQASKGAVTTFTKAAAAELAQYNIRVNAVLPGLIKTPMIGEFAEDPKAVESMLGPTLIRRLGSPEEVSYVVLFMASDESGYMTGSAVTVDGGYCAV